MMENFDFNNAPQKKEWKGVFIPKEIWENSDLSWMEKLFWCEIDGLDNEFGCYAGNSRFSETFGLSKNRCSEIINSLVSKGFITREFEYDRERIIKRTLRIVPVAKKYKKIEAPKKRIKIKDPVTGKIILSPSNKTKTIKKPTKKEIREKQEKVREKAGVRISDRGVRIPE